MTSNETWYDRHPNDAARMALYEQIVGKSGVYLIVTDPDTGEVLRDDRPWQMREGVS